MRKYFPFKLPREHYYLYKSYHDFLVIIFSFLFVKLPCGFHYVFFSTYSLAITCYTSWNFLCYYFDIFLVILTIFYLHHGKSFLFLLFKILFVQGNDDWAGSHTKGHVWPLVGSRWEVLVANQHVRSFNPPRGNQSFAPASPIFGGWILAASY